MITYLYRLYSDDELLYVGITNNPTHRWAAHRTQEDWWPSVKEMKLKEYPSLLEAETAEQESIKVEHPRHNLRNDSFHPGKKLSARELPEDEIQYLKSLEDDDRLLERAYELYRNGWPLITLANVVRLRPSTARLRELFAAIVPEETGHPLPEVPMTTTELAIAKRTTTHRKVSKRAITASEADNLLDLVNKGRKARHQHDPSHPNVVAYESATKLMQQYWDEGASVKEIIRASGLGKSAIIARINLNNVKNAPGT
jgi:hypothetical protein